jgi:hypothetical protein
VSQFEIDALTWDLAQSNLSHGLAPSRSKPNRSDTGRHVLAPRDGGGGRHSMVERYERFIRLATPTFACPALPQSQAAYAGATADQTLKRLMNLRAASATTLAISDSLSRTELRAQSQENATHGAAPTSEHECNGKSVAGLYKMELP